MTVFFTFYLKGLRSIDAVEGIVANMSNVDSEDLWVTSPEKHRMNILDFIIIVKLFETSEAPLIS